MKKEELAAKIPPQAEVIKILLPLVGPNGPYTIAVNERGRYFAKAQKNLAQFFVSQFNEYAKLDFIVYEEERYTYEQVWNITKRLAYVLRTKFNIKKGDRVAIAMRNCPEWCFAFLAISVAGGVPVPLNSWWKESELKYGVSDSGSKLIICDEQRFTYAYSFTQEMNVVSIVARASNKIQTKPENLVFRLESLISEEKVIPDSEFADIVQNTNPEDVSIIMYTSGTTGNPKGVVLTHRGVVDQMELPKLLTMVGEKIAQLPGMDPFPQVEQYAIVCGTPLFHVTASHHIFLQSLVNGRKMILLGKWDAEKALQLIEREKITSWTGVPTMAADLMEHPSFAKYDTSSLLTLGTGGAPTPISQVGKTIRTFKNAMPAAAYGLTETNGAICMNAGYGYLAQSDSVGVPFPIVEAKVVDDSGATLPSGQRGELLLKSSLVMKEYWNKPEATAEVLTKDYWFHTGDVAVIDAFGRIYIVDRQKDIIIRGGENISCTEVETAIYSHPAVRECSVFGLPDERLGEVVGALIWLKKPATPKEIIEHIQPLLAQFKIPLPENVFFTDKALPRGGTGKILKRTIRDEITRRRDAQKLANTQSKL